MSYRGLPYHFEVRGKTFRNDCKIWRSQPQKFNIDCHLTSTTSKCLSENLKKMSWDNLVSPIDAKKLVFLRPLTKIHTFHQYLEDLEWFEAIFKIFVRAIFEAIEVKGRSRLNFEAATLKFCNHFWKFGCQHWKSKYVCTTNGPKVLIYLSFLMFLKDLLL